MGLFYPNDSKSYPMDYPYASYLLDAHSGQSQIGYLFSCGATIISWWYMKQTIIATSSNHAKMLVLHEVSRECVWLRFIVQYV